MFHSIDRLLLLYGLTNTTVVDRIPDQPTVCHECNVGVPSLPLTLPLPCISSSTQWQIESIKVKLRLSATIRNSHNAAQRFVKPRRCSGLSLLSCTTRGLIVISGGHNCLKQGMVPAVESVYECHLIRYTLSCLSATICQCPLYICRFSKVLELKGGWQELHVVLVWNIML